MENEMAKVETNEVRKLTDTETMLGILQSENARLKDSARVNAEREALNVGTYKRNQEHLQQAKPVTRRHTKRVTCDSIRVHEQTDSVTPRLCRRPPLQVLARITAASYRLAAASRS
jgi:hypothetical protein